MTAIMHGAHGQHERITTLSAVYTTVRVGSWTGGQDGSAWRVRMPVRTTSSDRVVAGAFEDVGKILIQRIGDSLAIVVCDVARRVRQRGACDGDVRGCVCFR